MSKYFCPSVSRCTRSTRGQCRIGSMNRNIFAGTAFTCCDHLEAGRLLSLAKSSSAPFGILFRNLQYGLFSTQDILSASNPDSAHPELMGQWPWISFPLDLLSSFVWGTKRVGLLLTPFGWQRKNRGDPPILQGPYFSATQSWFN